MIKEPVDPEERTKVVKEFMGMLAAPFLFAVGFAALAASLRVVGTVLALTGVIYVVSSEIYWRQPDRREVPRSVKARFDYLCARLPWEARPSIIAWWVLLALFVISLTNWIIVTRPGR